MNRLRIRSAVSALARPLSLTRWEWFKLRRRRLPWVLLAMLVIFPQIGVVSSFFIYRGDVQGDGLYEYSIVYESADPPASFELTCRSFRDGQLTPEALSAIDGLPPSLRADVLAGVEDVRLLCDSDDLQESSSREFFVLPASLYNGLGISSGVAVLLTLFLTCAFVGGEYSWGTLRSTLALGTGRWPVLTSKLLVMFLAGAGGLAVSAMALVVVSLLLAVLTPNRDGLADTGQWATVAPVFFKLVFAMLPYIALAALLTVLTTSTSIGTGLAMGYFMVELALVGIMGQLFDWVETAARFMLGPSFNAWMTSKDVITVTLTNNLDDPVSAGGAFTVLLVYAVVFIAAALWLFQRRDIPGAKE